MITGQFRATTGNIYIEIRDGLEDTVIMDIESIGSLSYNFDQTPDSVSIDRVQALYSQMTVTAPNYSQTGAEGVESVDLWTRLNLASKDFQLGVLLQLTTFDGQEYNFPFRLRNGDMSFDERGQKITMRFIPFLNETIRNRDVFSAIDSTADDYRVQAGFNVRINSVKDWIRSATNLLFSNDFEFQFQPSETGLGGTYTDDLYDDLPESGQTGFVMVRATGVDESNNGTGFLPIPDGAEEISGLGLIELRAEDIPADLTTQTFMYGSGVDFRSLVKKEDKIYVRGKWVALVVDTVTDDPTKLRVLLNVAEEGSTPNPLPFNFLPYTILRDIYPLEIPALQTLKELAGIEGSVFGTGFSRNFYFNRLNQSGLTLQTLNYNDIVDFAPTGFNLSLGTSFVAQRADSSREGASELGDWPASVVFQPRRSGVPNLREFESLATGNKNGTKGIAIGLAPAYPFLNKVTAVLFPGVGASYQSAAQDDSLESALTRNGLTSYFQALNNTEGGLVIDFTILGALTVKPWEIFQFDDRAPVKYRNAQFRPTEISYDFISDTVRIKAYQIDNRRTPVFPDRQVNKGINFSFGQNLVPKGLFSAVQAQIGEAVGSVMDSLFITNKTYNAGETISELSVEAVREFGEDEFEDGVVAVRGFYVKLMNPITLKTATVQVIRNVKIGDEFIEITPVTLKDTFVSGSFVYLSASQITSGLITGEYLSRLFSSATSIGILTEDVKGVRTELPVLLNTRVRAGQDLQLPSAVLDGFTYQFTVAQDYDAGVRVINITDEDGAGTYIEAFADSIIIANPISTQAEFNISPGEIAFGVEQERNEEAIGLLNADIPTTAPVTVIPVRDAREVTLTDGMIISVKPRGGARIPVEFEVFQEQSISGTANINVVSKTPEFALFNGDSVVQPAWNQTGIITVNSNKIAAVVSDVEGLTETTAQLVLEVDDFERDITTIQNASTIGVTGELIGFSSRPGSISAFLDIDALNGDTTLQVNFGSPYNLKQNDIIEVENDIGVIEQFVVTSDISGGVGVVSVGISPAVVDTFTSGSPVYFIEGQRDKISITPSVKALYLAGQQLLVGRTLVVLDDKIETVIGTPIQIEFGVATFQHTPLGANVVEPARMVTEKLSTVGARAVLGVNASDNIAEIELFADGFGSEISINADQITLTGQTTFLTDFYKKTLSDGNVIIPSVSPPEERPNETPLQAGDVWLDTSLDDTTPKNDPYVYDGRTPYAEAGWIRGFTVISGGNITTGTIDAQRLDVVGIFAEEITVTGSIQSDDYDPGETGWIIDGADNSAEFNNVVVRGTLEGVTGTLGALTVEDTLTIDAGGAISIEGTQGVITIDENGIEAVLDSEVAFQLDLSTGLLSLTGDITVTGGVVAGSLEITDGDITVGTSTDGIVIDSGGIVGTVDSTEVFNLDLAEGKLSMKGEIIITGGELEGDLEANEYRFTSDGLEFDIPDDEGNFSKSIKFIDSQGLSSPLEIKASINTQITRMTFVTDEIVLPSLTTTTTFSRFLMIDSSGVVSSRNFSGLTGSVTISGQTLTFTNGILTGANPALT